MSELGDLLEVVHRAHRSYTSARLAVREWRHHRRLQAAYDRAAQRAGAGVEIARLGAADEVPAETDVGVHPWFEQYLERGEDVPGIAERDGRSLRISAGPWHRVLLEERGTFVELDSQTVETEALVELALALEPAPTEPPPLVA